MLTSFGLKIQEFHFDEVVRVGSQELLVVGCSLLHDMPVCLQLPFELEYCRYVFALGQGNVILFTQQTLQGFKWKLSLDSDAGDIATLEIRAEFNLDASRDQRN